MSLMQWSSNLSVNIQDFDRQHKKLLDLINHLHGAMSSGKGKDVLQDLFTELIEYTTSHFSQEEELMKKYQYGQFSTHKKEHDTLTKKVGELYESYKAGKLLLTVEIYSFLKDWLTNHIQGTDRKYTAYLNAQGVS